MKAAAAHIALGLGNFQSEVLDNPQPILIDFWAPWCGPCRMMKPILEGAALELEGLARVGMVNVDEEPGLAEAFGIRGIPTLVLMKGKDALGGRSGLTSQEELVSWVKDHLPQ